MILELSVYTSYNNLITCIYMYKMKAFKRGRMYVIKK